MFQFEGSAEGQTRINLKSMPMCPICERSADPADLGTFVLHRVLYHERCIPDCENCGKEVPNFNCDRVWDDDPPNKKWKARHLHC